MRFVLALITSVVSVPVWAASVAVFPVNAVNLDAGSAAAIGEVLARSYARASNQPVLPPSQSASAVQTDNSFSAAAQALGVGEYIEITAVGLGGSDTLLIERRRDGVGVGNEDTKILVQATRREANGQEIYRAEMTARTLNDMDDVCERMALSLFNKKPVAETRSVRNVTRDEAAPENRTFTEKIWGIRTQVLVPLASGQQFEPTAGLTFDWRLESRNYFLEFGFGFFIPTDSSEKAYGYGGLQAEVGGSYYLTEDTVSPYVGAGIQPRIMMASHFDSGINMVPYVQGGVMFARDSSSRIYTDLRVGQNVLPVKRDRPFDWATGERVSNPKTFYPSEISLQVGIGW